MMAKGPEVEATFSSCCALCQNDSDSGSSSSSSHGFSIRSRACSSTTSIDAGIYGSSRSCQSSDGTCDCNGHWNGRRRVLESSTDSDLSQIASSEEACSGYNREHSSHSSDSCSNEESEYSACGSNLSTEGNSVSACSACGHGTAFRAAAERQFHTGSEINKSQHNTVVWQDETCRKSGEAESTGCHLEAYKIEACVNPNRKAFSASLSAALPGGVRSCTSSGRNTFVVPACAETAHLAVECMERESGDGPCADLDAGTSRLPVRHSDINGHLALTQQRLHLCQYAPTYKHGVVCCDTTEMQTSGGPQCRTVHQYYRHSGQERCAQEQGAQVEPPIHQLCRLGHTQHHNLSEVGDASPSLLCEQRDRSAGEAGYSNVASTTSNPSLGQSQGSSVPRKDAFVQPRQVELFTHCHSVAVEASHPTSFQTEERCSRFAGGHTVPDHGVPLLLSLEATHLNECAGWSLKRAAAFQRRSTSIDLAEQERAKPELIRRAFRDGHVVNSVALKNEVFATPCSHHSNDDLQCQKDAASMQTAVGTSPAAVSSTTLDVKLLQQQQQQQLTHQFHVSKERHDLVVEPHKEVEADSQQKESNKHVLPQEGRSYLVQHAAGSVGAPVAAVSDMHLVRDQQYQQDARVFQHSERCVRGHVHGVRRRCENSNISVQLSAAAVSVGKRESSSRAAEHTSAQAVIDKEGTATICIHAHMAPSQAAADRIDETLVIPNAVELWNRLQKAKQRMKALQAQRKELQFSQAQEHSLTRGRRGHIAQRLQCARMSVPPLHLLENQKNSRPTEGLSREGAQERGRSKEKLQERLQPTQEQTLLPQQLEESLQRASVAEEALKFTEQKLLEKEEFVKLLQGQMQHLMHSATQQQAELAKAKEECQQAREAVKDIRKPEPNQLQTHGFIPNEQDEAKRPMDRQVLQMEGHSGLQLQCQTLSSLVDDGGARTAAEKSQSWQVEAARANDAAIQQQLESEVKSLQMQLQEAHQQHAVMEEKLSAVQREKAHQQELQATLSALVMNAEARVKEAEYSEQQHKQLISQLQSDVQRKAAESERERQQRISIKQQLDDLQAWQRASEELRQLQHQCQLHQQEVECRLMQRHELETELYLLGEMQKRHCSVENDSSHIAQIRGCTGNERTTTKPQSRVDQHDERWLQEVANNAVRTVEVHILSSVCQTTQQLRNRYVETLLRQTERAQPSQGKYEQEKEPWQDLGDQVSLEKVPQQDNMSIFERNGARLMEQHDAWERRHMRQEELEQLLVLGRAREQQMRVQQIEQQRRHEGQLRELQENLSRARQAVGKPLQGRTRKQQDEHLRQQLNRHDASGSVSLDTPIEQLESSIVNSKESVVKEIGDQTQSLRVQLKGTEEEILTLQKQLQETVLQRDSLDAKLQQAQQEREVERHTCPHHDEIQPKDEEEKQQNDATESHEHLEGQLLSVREELQQQRAQQEAVEHDYRQRLHMLEQEYQEKIRTEVANLAQLTQNTQTQLGAYLETNQQTWLCGEALMRSQELTGDHVDLEGQRTTLRDAVEQYEAERQNESTSKDTATERQLGSLDKRAKRTENSMERNRAEVEHSMHKEPSVLSSHYIAAPQSELIRDKNTEERDEKGGENQQKASTANVDRDTFITGLEGTEDGTTSQEWRNKFEQSEKGRQQALQQVEELQRLYDAQTALLQRDQERLKRRKEAHAAVLRQHLRSDDVLTPLQLQQLFLSVLGHRAVGDKDSEAEKRKQHQQVHQLQQQLREERERALKEKKGQRQQQMELEDRLQTMDELNIMLHQRLLEQQRQRNDTVPAASTCKVDMTAVEEPEIAQRALTLKNPYTTCLNQPQCTLGPELAGEVPPPQMSPRGSIPDRRSSVGRACGFKGISCGRTLDDCDSLLCNYSVTCNRPRQLPACTADDRPRPHSASEVLCGTEQTLFPLRRSTLVRSLRTSTELSSPPEAIPGEAKLEDYQITSNPKILSCLEENAPQRWPAGHARLIEALTVEVQTLQDLLQLRDREIRVLLNCVLQKKTVNQRENLSLNELCQTKPNRKHSAALDSFCKEMKPPGKSAGLASFLTHLIYFSKSKLETFGQMRSPLQAKLPQQKAIGSLNAISQLQHNTQAACHSRPYSRRPSPLPDTKENPEQQQQQVQLGLLMALKRTQNVPAVELSFLARQQLSIAGTCKAVPKASVDKFFRPLLVRRKQRREQTLTHSGSCGKVAALLDAVAASKDGKRSSASVLARYVGSGKLAELLDLVRHEWKVALKQQRSPQDFFRCLDPAGLTAYTFNKTPFSFLVSSSVSLEDTIRLHAGFLSPPVSFPSGRGGDRRNTRCSGCTSDVTISANWRDSPMCLSAYENAAAFGTSDGSTTTRSLSWWTDQRGQDSLKDGNQQYQGGDRPHEPSVLTRVSRSTLQGRNTQTKTQKSLVVYHLSALGRTSQTRCYKYATMDAFPPPDAFPTASPVLLYHLSPNAARLRVDFHYDSNDTISLSLHERRHVERRGKGSCTQAKNGDAAWEQPGNPVLGCSVHCKPRHTESEHAPSFQQSPLVARLRHMPLTAGSRAPDYVSFSLEQTDVPISEKLAKVNEDTQENVLRSEEPKDSSGQPALTKQEDFQHCHEAYFLTQLTQAPVDESLLLLHFCTGKAPLTQITGIEGGVRVYRWKETQTGAVAGQLEGKHFKIQHAFSGLYFALAIPARQGNHCGDATAADVRELSNVASEIEALVAVARSRGAFSHHSESDASAGSVFPYGLVLTRGRAKIPDITSNTQGKGISELYQRRPEPHHNCRTSRELMDQSAPSSATAPQLSRLIAVSDKELATPFVFTREASLLEFRAVCQVVSERRH